MYQRRLYILLSCCAAAVAVCVVRLAFLQLAQGQKLRDEMEEWRVLPSQPVPTARGSILDRNGNVLAQDKLVFWLHINYRLTKFADERYRRAAILIDIENGASPDEAQRTYDVENQARLEKLDTIAAKCAQVMGQPAEEIRERISDINDRMWRRREFYAWSDNCPDSALYGHGYVPQSKACEEFGERFDEETRLKLAFKSERMDMYEAQPLFKLNEPQLALAYGEFLGMENEVEILPESTRDYPFGSAACLVIGWMGPVKKEDRLLFEDEYLKYLDNDECGASGAEWVCEGLLRGRRGEVKYDKNHNEIARTPRQCGKDVRLSLDIHLQQQIESYLVDPNENRKNFDKSIGAVVLDVVSGDVLAMVSTPVFDLNTFRQSKAKYEALVADDRNPFLNKAIDGEYPPGSTIKPVLLAVALQEKRLSAGEVISCPSHAAPDGWPNCLIFRSRGYGHDSKHPIPNNARNAIRWSCNVYFSHVADRLDPTVLQRWLFDLGYGRHILPGPFAGPGEEAADVPAGLNRFLDLAESTGRISSKPQGPVRSAEDLPPLYKQELRWFGIGQGRLTATVLQVANAVAVPARGGIYKSPRLFLDTGTDNDPAKDLGISEATIAVIRDGMRAVVTEESGTARTAFRDSRLNKADIKIFGKTGSTTGLRRSDENAWFMAFAEDSAGRCISVAIVVHEGQAGSDDAAPLGEHILGLCHDAGYIGSRQ